MEGKGGFSYSDLVDAYNAEFEPKLSGRTLEKYVRLLQHVGYVDVQPNPADKRMRLIGVIKNPGNLLESALCTFPASFTLESLKKWFDDAKNYAPENEVYIIKNLTERKVHLDLENLHKKHYIKNEFLGAYFSEENAKEKGLKMEKEPKNVHGAQRSIFLSFSIDQILSGPHILAFTISQANECPGCGEKRILNYSISLFDGSTIRICHECADKVEDSLKRRVENG